MFVRLLTKLIAMLKFTNQNTELEKFVLFRDNNYSDLFYYLNKSPNISYFVDRPAVMFEYEKTLDRISKLLIRIKVNYIATPTELSEMQQFLKNRYRIRQPYIAPAPMTIAKIKLRFTYLKEVIWESVEEQQTMNNRFTQIVQFVAKNEIAQKMFESINRGGANIQVDFHVGVVGKPPENPAKIFIQWASIYKKFDLSLHKTFTSEEIYEIVNKWMIQNLDDVYFNRIDDNIRHIANQDITTEVAKVTFNKLFIKKNKKELNPVHTILGNTISRTDVESKLQLKDLSSIEPEAETIHLYWKSNKVVDYKFDCTFKELVRHVPNVNQYCDDITNFLNFKTVSIYVAVSQNTFDFVNIRRIDVAVEIIHKKTNFVEKKLNFHFEKGGSNLNVEPYTFVDKFSSYIINFKVFYCIVETNNFTIQSIERNPKVENRTHLYIDPTTDFNVYFFRFLLDKAKRLSIYEMIVAKIVFKNSQKTVSVWEISQSLDKNSIENTIAYLSTSNNVFAKVNLEYFSSDGKIANKYFLDTNNNCYIVDNPYENCWDVEVECQADWSNTIKVLLEAYTYEMGSQTVHSKKKEFNKNETTRTIGFSRRHQFDEYTFYYRIICITVEGSIICQTGLKHKGDKLIISDKIESTRTIHGYLPPGFDFSKKPYHKIGWTIRYFDKKNNINFVSEPKYFTKEVDYHKITHNIANHYFTRYEYCYTLEYDDIIDREKSVWFTAEQEQIFLNIE